jgi:hypothetical protein
VIHEDAAHDARGDGEELGAIRPRDPPLVDEPEIGFVDEPRGTQGVSGRLPAELPARDATQLLIDERHEDIRRALIAVAEPEEQLGDAAWSVVGERHGEELGARS